MLSRFACVPLFAALWTVAHQAPLSMGFSRQEYWTGLPCPPPGDLCNPGVEVVSPALQVDSLPTEPPRKPFIIYIIYLCFSFYSHSGEGNGNPLQ